MIGDSHKGSGHGIGERLLEAANGSGQFEASSKAIRRGAVGTRAPLPDHEIGTDSVRLIAWRRSTPCVPRYAALDGSQHDLVHEFIDATGMTLEEAWTFVRLFQMGCRIVQRDVWLS
jgi:hypothetical protein